ncbi:MAG: 7-cyano-7-deazaguanine synthase QueC [Gammaproteobacteria bacterium]|nr:7-cyano-7-deazaguanine synthase QueC [Gammaproteobacteria bacterium]
MNSQDTKKAVVLVSGGLDSATTLAIAKDQGFDCFALSFDYQQRHRSELAAAGNIAEFFEVSEHRLMKIDSGGPSGSALTDMDIAIPDTLQQGIPVTYVPARNTVFLALALGYAEVIGASAIFIGVNAVDYSGYPDCRPEFINAFEVLSNVATKAAAHGRRMRIHTPLMAMDKARIIRTGIELGIDYSITVSCYQADSEGRACSVCDSCRLRSAGFEAAGIADPTVYA